MRHVIVNSITGEIDADCGICGYGVSSDYSDFENFNAPDHSIIEINNDEHTAIIESLTVDEKGIVTLGAKIDIEKARMKLEDRLKVDVPIEIDGMGGKEIIGYELKPEGIVVEKGKDDKTVLKKPAN